MARPWYPRYPDDYDRKTAGLSFAEHGAYGLLLDRYYSVGGPLKDDAEHLFRVCRGRGASERKALTAVLQRFFVVRAGHFHNERADEEITRAQEIHEKRVKGGICSAQARTRVATHAEHKGAVRARTLHPQPQLQEQTDTEPSLESVGSADAKPKKGTRWESTRIIEKQWLSDAFDARTNRGLPPVDLELEAEKFANWAVNAKPKIDWRRAFINWCLNARGSANAIPGSNGRNPHRSSDTLAKLGDDYRAARAREVGGG